MSFTGQHAQVIWQHAIQVLGEQRKGPFFGASNRFSTATGDPTHFLQPLLGSDPFGISQGHSGSESNEPSLAHQVAASHRKIKSWSKHSIENWIEIIKMRQHDSRHLVTTTHQKALLLTKTQTSKYDSTSLQNVHSLSTGPSLIGASSRHDPPRIQPGNASVI